MMENNPQGFKELQPGSVLNAGKYIIEKKLGEGGFGITYKAVQTGLYRPVCIKEYFLAGRCVRNTQARTVHLQGISEEMYEKYRLAFVKEAQTVASLHHPNIVEVIDIFDENNTSYMVMSFIEGRSLQDIVDTNGPLSYPDAVNYMAQVTSAVEYIHKHNILHRDIKPENIMVTADYKAILIDFGSAREFEQDKTQVHTTMLTHGYAPPEQYTANSKKGSYTDIYALGATLYFILTGKVPLEAAARWTEELVEPKQLNPSIPDEGNRTIMKAMKLKKEERYQLVQDFMKDLKNMHGGASGEGNGGSSQPKTKRWILWVVLAAVLLAGTVVATYKLVQGNSPASEIEVAYIQTLKNNHKKAVDEFDRMSKNIVEDKFGKPGVQIWVIGAHDWLKTIEQCENDSLNLFRKTGEEPVFEGKLKLYREKLEEAKTKLYNNINDRQDKDEFYGGESNPLFDDLRDRLKVIDDMQKQTEDGTVLNDVLISPPNAKKQPE